MDFTDKTAEWIFLIVVAALAATFFGYLIIDGLVHRLKARRHRRPPDLSDTE